MVTFSSATHKHTKSPDIPTNVFYFGSLGSAQLINPNIHVRIV